METEFNNDHIENDDQVSHDENQLSQGIERSEESPSWEGQDDDTSLEDQDFTAAEEDNFGSEEEIETDDQQKTPPEGSRRVLSFNDFFGRNN